MPHASPLKGKCVVITRKKSGDKRWELYLKKYGAIVKYFPTIKTVPVPLAAKHRNAIKNIDTFDWIVFTSAEGVHSFRAAKGRRMPRIAAIGTATALALRKAGYRVAFQPTTPTGEILAKQLPSVKGKSIVLLRAAIASPELPKILTTRGANVTDIPVYKTQTIRGRDVSFEAALVKGHADHIIFASLSAVRGFFTRVPKKFHQQTLSIPVVAIGKSLVKPLKERGFRIVHVSKNPTIEGIVRAMI